MAETLTSAGCGGRTRRRIALLGFAVGALGGAAALGAALGALGAALPRGGTLAFAALIALLGALRELGLRAIPLPERRWQVPEPWRRTMPIGAWSTAYGALLGVGLATHQAVATFWAVCAGVVAIGDRRAGALCLALFGAGRVVMLLAPAGDPLGRLSRAYPIVRPANAIALLGCATLLVPAAAAAAPAPPPPPPRGQSEPSVSNNVIAFTDQANGVSNVVVSAPNAAPVVFPDGRSPAISGDTLAYVDSAGIRVVLWRTQQEVARFNGPFATPGLSGPRLAYVERLPSRQRLIVRNISTGAVRTLARVPAGEWIGRPSVFGQLVAWHESAGNRNQIFVHSLRSRTTELVVAGRRSFALINPVLAAGQIAWVQSVGERSNLVVRNLRGGPVKAVAGTLGPRFLFLTTAIEPGSVWVTRVSVDANAALIQRFPWKPLPPPRPGR